MEEYQAVIEGEQAAIEEEEKTINGTKREPATSVKN